MWEGIRTVRCATQASIDIMSRTQRPDTWTWAVERKQKCEQGSQLGEGSEYQQDGISRRSDSCQTSTTVHQDGAGGARRAGWTKTASVQSERVVRVDIYERNYPDVQLLDPRTQRRAVLDESGQPCPRLIGLGRVHGPSRSLRPGGIYAQYPRLGRYRPSRCPLDAIGQSGSDR